MASTPIGPTGAAIEKPISRPRRKKLTSMLRSFVQDRAQSPAGGGRHSDDQLCKHQIRQYKENPPDRLDLAGVTAWRRTGATNQIPLAAAGSAAGRFGWCARLDLVSSHCP